MTDLATMEAGIAPMSAGAIANVAALERQVLACPQTRIKTHHVLHGGLYARTILIPAGVVLTGALIKIPTLLVIAGDVLVYVGEGQRTRITGIAVIPASAGRKQAFVTYQDTSISMVFPTRSTNVEQAEAEFTDDVALLFSRRDADLNTEIITGE